MCIEWKCMYSLEKWNHDECWYDCKELNGRGSCINDNIWKPSTCDCECKKAYKVDEYLNIENCSCGKRLFDKLILTCKDKILSTTETLLDNKILICENNCLFHFLSMVIIGTLLLAAVSIGCYYYYTRYWKNKDLLPFYNTSIKLGKIDIRNIS